MGSRRELGNKSDFFRQKTVDAAQGFHESNAAAEKSMEAYIANMHKSKVTVDIDLFDDAPEAWNEFPAPPQVREVQMKMSIMNNGIIQPVIAWKQPNGRYMILAGHTRIHLSREILEEYAESEHRRDYRAIPTIAFEYDEITEEKAREIIIDTNYLQRGEMDPRTRVAIIKARIDLMNAQTDEKGRTVAQYLDTLTDFGIKKSSAYQDVQIGTAIIAPLRELYFNSTISRSAVLRFAMFPENIQQWIYETYPDKLTSAYISKLKKGMKTKEDIAEAFQDEEEPDNLVRTQIKVPSSRLRDFRRVSAAYLDDAQFRVMCDNYLNKKYGK